MNKLLRFNTIYDITDIVKVFITYFIEIHYFI